MNLKKLGASLLLSAVGIAIPFSSAFAGSWDYKGNYSFHYNSTHGYVTDIVYSTGGYIKFCPSQWGTSVKSYTVWEYDPDNPDDKIASFDFVSNGECKTVYVNNYVDGSNNRAEIYIATDGYLASSTYVDIWD
ncbi:hypothetical protein MK805_07600 [Shimazuella sp. AN120528]|uniref:hypothetical protein n=1 Tax=Shimazuella soli TaxID=1892854 RepID=UPI001F105969|nr:hypothetical protein [Shimazuella soli]MCH5584837.1 hypothetical protein [Shimazuella soli]